MAVGAKKITDLYSPYGPGSYASFKRLQGLQTPRPNATAVSISQEALKALDEARRASLVRKNKPFIVSDKSSIVDRQMTCYALVILAVVGAFFVACGDYIIAKHRYLFSFIADILRLTRSIGSSINKGAKWVPILGIVAGSFTIVGGIFLYIRTKERIRKAQEAGDIEGEKQARLLNSISYGVVGLGLLLLLKYVLPLIGLGAAVPFYLYALILLLIVLNINSIRLGRRARQEVVQLIKELKTLQKSDKTFMDHYRQVFCDEAQKAQKAVLNRVLSKKVVEKLSSFANAYDLAVNKGQFIQDKKKTIVEMGKMVEKNLITARRIQTAIIVSAIVGFTTAGVISLGLLLPLLANYTSIELAYFSIVIGNLNTSFWLWMDSLPIFA